MDSGKFPYASESLISDITNKRSRERDIAGGCSSWPGIPLYRAVSVRRKGAQSLLSLACIRPSISFERKPPKDGASCSKSTLDSLSNLVSSVVSPSVLVVCSRIFFSRAWFFCCSRTSWYSRAARFSTPLVVFFLRLLLLFLVVLGLSSPLVSSAVRVSSVPSGDARVIGGLDSTGLMMPGLSQWAVHRGGRVARPLLSNGTKRVTSLSTTPQRSWATTRFGCVA